MLLKIRKSPIKFEYKAFSKFVKKFSSRDEQYPSQKLYLEIVNRDSNFVWPETRLGVLEPKDSRFPFPGLVGSFTLSKEINEQKENKIDDYEIDLLAHELNHERHSSILEQFLTVNKKSMKNDSTEQLENHFNNFNYIIRECPVFVKRDFQVLYPSFNLLNRRLTVILFYSNKNANKDLRINSFFMDTASNICKSLHMAGFWADFNDSKSGRPYLAESIHSAFLYETEMRCTKFGLHFEDCNGCTIIKYISSDDAFIGFLLTTAPLNHPLIFSLNNIFQ